ncbi:hypothetical protein C0995_005396, partial [Termitomyces sp. Mi166
MVPKISLVKISANASLLECKCAAQEFIVAADAVFFKAQGLAMLAPLHETAFGLLEGLLDDWHLLNLDLVEWKRKAEVCQACINLWSLNKQVPWCAEFGKTVMAIKLELTAPVVAPRTVMDLVPTPASATSLIQHAPSVPYIVDPSSPPMHLHSELLLQEHKEVCAITLLPTQEQPSQLVAPHNKGKGKAKAMEKNEDKEGEAAQKLRKELEDFMFDDKLLASLLPPLMEFYKRDIELLQGAKILGGRKGDITLVSPAIWALVLEKNGTMHAKHVKLVQAAKAFLKKQGKSSQFFVLESFKGKGKAKALLGDSEQMGTKRSSKSTDLVDSNSNKEEEEERVHVIKKIKHEHVEELTGARKGKEIIELEDEEAPEPADATPISKPAPVKSASKPAVKGGFVFKDPFMMTKVAATQETLQDEDTSNKDENNEDSNDDEGGKGNDDDSNNDDAAMDIDS